MKKYNYYQHGSAMVVIVSVLVVALVAALGFIFWQNFLSTGDKGNSSATKTTTAESDSSKKSNTTDNTPVAGLHTGSEANSLVASAYKKYIDSRKSGSSAEQALVAIRDSLSDNAYNELVAVKSTEAFTCAANYIPDAVTVNTVADNAAATSTVAREYQGQTATATISVVTDLTTLKITSVTCPQ